MRFIVLAGGFGTRLKSAVANVPKALAPIGDVPFLRLQLQHWINQGVREFTFLLHHQAGEIVAFLNSEKLQLLKDCNVNWLIEPIPMDTGGAVAHAVTELKLKGDFIVANADTWLGTGISELQRSNSLSIAVVKLAYVNRYGQVGFDEESLVVSFLEKSQRSEPGWINAGLFRLRASLFESWDGKPFSLERELLVKLAQTRQLRAVQLNTDFLDIGIPEDYSRFCNWVADGRRTAL